MLVNRIKKPFSNTRPRKKSYDVLKVAEIFVTPCIFSTKKIRRNKCDLGPDFVAPDGGKFLKYI